MSGKKFLQDATVHQSSEKEQRINRNVSLIYKIYKKRFDIALNLFNTMLVEDDVMTETMIRYCKRQRIHEKDLQKSPKQLIQFLFYYKHSYELGIVGR